MRKEEQNSGKSRLYKRLFDDKRSFENATSSLSVFFIIPALIWLLSKIQWIRQIFKFLPKVYYNAKKFCNLATTGSKTTAISIFSEITTEVLCLVFVYWRNKIYLIILICIICDIDYWKIVNWGYKKAAFTENRLLKYYFVISSLTTLFDVEKDTVVI